MRRRFPLILLLITFAAVILIARGEPTNTDKLLRKSVSVSHFLGSRFLQSLTWRQFSSTNISVELDAIASTSPEKLLRPSMALGYKLIWTYIGFLILFTFGILFVVILPIFGLIFFCCRCCNRCGGRVDLGDKRRDPCRRSLYSTILAIIATIQLTALGVACINNYLTNQAITKDDFVFNPMLEKLDGLSIAIKNMLDKTKSTIDVQLDAELANFHEALNGAIDNMKFDFIDQSKVRAFMDPFTKAKDLTKMYIPLESTDKGRDLTKFLDDIKTIPLTVKDINDYFVQNSQPKQINLVSPISEDDLNMIEKALTVLRSTDVNKIDRLDEYKKAVDEMKIREDIKSQLNDKFETLTKASDLRRILLENLETGTEYVTKTAIPMVKPYIKDDSPGSIKGQTRKYENVFRYYAFYGILSIPLLIVVCMFFGLCFGICGRRPVRDAGCCNKGVGSNFLMAVVIFIFFLGPLLMLVCMAFLGTTGMVENSVCGPLADPPRGETTLLDIIFRQSVQGTNYAKWMQNLMPFESIWGRCKSRNVIDSLGLSNLELPIDEQIMEKVDDLLQSFKEALKKTNLGEKIQQTKRTLDDPSLQAVINAEFMSSLENLQSKFNQYLFDANSLQDARAFLPEKRTDLIKRIETIIDLDSQRNKMLGYVNDLLSATQNLQNGKIQLETFLLENANIDETVSVWVDTAVEKSFRPVVKRQFRYAVMAIWKEIDCKELHKVAHQFSDTFCVNLLQPLNGYWLSLGVCVILYIPTLVFCVILISLYRKTDQYYRDVSDANYMNFQGYYMADYNTEFVDPKMKRKKAKSRNNLPKPGVASPSSIHGQPGYPLTQGYQRVPVYPYDAYE